MAEKVERSVMLSKETAGALTRYAKRNHISGSEAIRRFVEKGLNMDSYTSEQEVIRNYIKSELAADIKPYMGTNHKNAGEVREKFRSSAYGRSSCAG